MSSTSTVYDVKVKYSLDDKASAGVKGIASATDKAAQSAFSLKGALAAVGGVALLKGAKESLIDFNSEVEQMKISMTAVMQMQLHMPFKKASEEADKLFKTFQELAKKSPATTKDFMEMANAIAPAVALAGGGPGKLAKLTQGGVLASLAFGERADVVGRDIKQMLAGTVGVKDPLAMQLLGSKNIDHKDFNQFSAKKRAETTESLLGDNQALKDASERMGESFAGQTSTLKDQLQITLGEVGKPLMEDITAEVKKWNTWIEKHPKLIREWVTSFSNGLRSGFEFLKSVASFFIENRDLLMGLAKTFVIFKGAQMAGNIFTKFTQGISGLADSMAKGVTAISGGVGGLTSAFGGLTGIAKGLVTNVVPALFAFQTGLEIASHFLGVRNENEKKARDNAITLNEATGEIPGMRARLPILQKMISTAKSDEDKARFQTEFDTLHKKAYDAETTGIALRKIHEASIGKKDASGNTAISIKDTPLEYMTVKNILNHLPDTFDRSNVAENTKIMKGIESILQSSFESGEKFRLEVLKYAFPEQFGMPTPKETVPEPAWKGVDTKDVNVTIHKVEVASEDPDRFVFGLVRMADQALKHSTQSQHTIPGGF